MFSKIQLTRSQEQKLEQKNKSHSPSRYPKKRRKNPLSQNLQKHSMKSLKQAITKQKEKVDQEGLIGAKSPSFFFDTLIDQAKEIKKITLSAEIQSLCDKLVDTLIHTDREGIRETTFFLDQAHFASSSLYGTKVTLTEYSTAPKLFNIHFSVSAEGVDLFAKHAQDLLTTLRNRQLHFGVHRIDTSLLSEKDRPSIPPVERKREKEENE